MPGRTGSAARRRDPSGVATPEFVGGAAVREMEHEVWLDANPVDVFAALTTKKGLDAWWGPVLNAEPRIGSVVEFDHGLGSPLRMEIIALIPNEKLAWRCVSEFSDPSNPASEW